MFVFDDKGNGMWVDNPDDPRDKFKRRALGIDYYRRKQEKEEHEAKGGSLTLEELTNLSDMLSSISVAEDKEALLPVIRATSKSRCRKCGGLTHEVNKRLYCDHCGYQDGTR